MGANHSLIYPVIFYDGVCNFCDASVNFLIKIDKKQLFRYASLQSEFAKKTLPKPFLIDVEDSFKDKSIVFFLDNLAFTKSDAILEILKSLGFPWKILFYIGVCMPKFLRDFLYKFIAKNRYLIFGRKNSCKIPNEKERILFLS